LIDKEKQIYHCTTYYKNGVVESEGTLLEDGRKDGAWKEYFSDGVLKWDGFISKGYIVIAESEEKMRDFIRLPMRLEIKKTQGELLKVGKAYKIRTIVKGVHPSLYNVLVNSPNKIEENEEDPDRYPLVVTPKEAGKMYIIFVFPDKDGRLVLGHEDTNVVSIVDVVE